MRTRFSSPDRDMGYYAHAKCQLEIWSAKQLFVHFTLRGEPAQGRVKRRDLYCLRSDFILSGALFLGCTQHLASSLTAVSCGGFQDFPATGKPGGTPGTRAPWTVRSERKCAPTLLKTRTAKHWIPQRTQETISRLSKSALSQGSPVFLKNLRNNSVRNWVPRTVKPSTRK